MGFRERAKTVTILFFLGIFIFSIGLAGLEGSDWILLNNTFFYTNTFTMNITNQYTDDFESNYGGSRVEDMDIPATSSYWVNAGGGTFTLKLAETLGNEWQSGSTIAYYEDNVEDDYGLVTREQITELGFCQNNDYYEFELYNPTGSGNYGCMFLLGEVTGNGNAVLLVNAGNFIAIDNLTPVVLEAVTADTWIHIKIISSCPDEFNITIGDNTYGPYKVYNGLSWGADPVGNIRSLTLGTFPTVNADTCTFYMDNLSNSWEANKPFIIKSVPGETWDIPQITIGSNVSQFNIPALYVYTTDLSANLVVSENGDILRSASSEIYKSQITNITSLDSNKIMELIPRVYKYDTTNTWRYGFIAQEVGKTSPYLADYNKKGEPTNINTNSILALLTKKVQEQQILLDKICKAQPVLCK